MLQKRSHTDRLVSCPKLRKQPISMIFLFREVQTTLELNEWVLQQLYFLLKEVTLTLKGGRCSRTSLRLLCDLVQGTSHHRMLVLEVPVKNLSKLAIQRG